MANSADPDQLPTDLNLHCLQKQGISGFSRTIVKRKGKYKISAERKPKASVRGVNEEKYRTVNKPLQIDFKTSRRQNVRKCTFGHVCPVKNQISLLTYA